MKNNKVVNLPLHILIKNANRTYNFIGYNDIPHCDLTIAPIGKGLEAAILKLGEYPSETKFMVDSQFDGLTFFTVEDKNDCFSLWNEDLIECIERGYISADGGLSIHEPKNSLFGELSEIQFLNGYMKTTDYFLNAAETCHKTREIFKDLDKREYWKKEVIPLLLDGKFHEVVYKTSVRLEALIKDLAISHFKDNQNDQKVKLKILNKFYEGKDTALNVEKIKKKMFGVKLVDYSLDKNGVLYINDQFYKDVKEYFIFVRNKYSHNIIHESEDIVIEHLKKAIRYYEEIDRLGKNKKISRFY